MCLHVGYAGPHPIRLLRLCPTCCLKQIRLCGSGQSGVPLYPHDIPLEGHLLWDPALPATTKRGVASVAPRRPEIFNILMI